MVNEKGKEQFMLRMSGGPHPGTYVVTEGDVKYGFLAEWPMPERFNDEDGYYNKISESQIPKK